MPAYSNFAYAGGCSTMMNIVLTVLVCRNAPTRAIARVYLATGTAIAAWCALAAALFVVRSAATAMIVVQVLHVAVLFVPATTLQLTLLVAGIRAPGWMRIVYGLTFALLAIMPFGAYIHGIVRHPHAWYAIAGPGFWIFSVLLPAISIPMLTALARRRRSEQVNKRRYTVLMAANALMIATGAHDCLPVCGWVTYPHTNVLVYPWGTYAAMFYGALFAYAALQEHALDVRFDVTKHVGAFVRIGIGFAVGFPLLFAASAWLGGLSPLAFGIALGTLLLATAAAMLLTPRLLAAISSSLHAQALSESSDYRAGVVQTAESLLALTSYEEIWHAVRTALRDAMRIETFCWAVVDAQRRQLRFTAAFPEKPVAPKWNISGPLFAVFDPGNRSHFDVRSPAPAGSDPLAAAQAEARVLGGEFVFACPGAPDVRGVLVVSRKARGYTTLDVELLTHVAQRLGRAAQRVDITQRASRAERHELLSLMGRGLAHDLQNLVVPVRTFLDVMRRSPRLDERERGLHLVASDSLSAVRAYLANAVLFGGDMQLRLVRATAGAVVGAAAATVAPRAAERNVELRLCSDSTEVTMDAVLIERTISNLLANAIDASRADGVVEVLSGGSDDGNAIRFEVRDHGTGIDRSIQPSLFQPYFTTKGSGADGPRGFGLGLALCQRIVELHEGRIWFETQPGTGTSFFVELPCLARRGND